MNKSQLAEAYNKYLGPKCSKTTYYKNLRKGMNFIDALQPVPKEKRYITKFKSKRFLEELKRYQEQKQPKPTRSRFYQRLYQGWTKEEAILLKVPIRCKKIVWKKKEAYIRPPIKISVDRTDYHEIRVKYTREEARIFSREYENMIGELQDRYNATDDMAESKEINAKLEKLVKEYQLFLECQSPERTAVI